jgi:two-component system, cell cycle sensor histidine kinase and response regulator CckA
MNTYKVLIAEDEGLIAMDIAAHLESLGHTVVATVSTAAEAIEQARHAQVVLMDIRLDGPVDGIEAASKIRERYRLPVLFLTAQADPSTLERAKLAAPYGYMIKPLAPASLQPSIEIAMHKHKLETRLEESEAWLRATLASAPDAVIVTDPEGQIRFLNPAAEALGGRPLTAVSQLLPEDPVPLAILQDRPVAIETQVAEQWVEGSASPLKISGEVIGGVVTLRDVTARRREEQRLLHLEKADMAARLATAVAVDFANPIEVIRNHSAQLLRQFADYSPVYTTIKEIQQAALTADKINRRLADLGAQPHGPLQVLSLNGILRRMFKFIQSVAGDQIAVTFHADPDAGKIYADPAHTEEVIMQLVLFSVKAMPCGGQLGLNTATAGDRILLSVTHTGSPADLDSANLSLMRYFTADGNRLEVSFEQWTDPEPAGGIPPTILLIEPREHIRARLHNVFESNGFNLLEAADETQANALLDLHEVDLVVGGDVDQNAVPVLRLRPPYTEQQLLEEVRARLDPPLTFSASR